MKWRCRSHVALLSIVTVLLIVGCAKDIPTPTPVLTTPPTPVPTATPIPTPTATPTPVPTATPTPVPTATPTPPYTAAWNNLEHTDWLDMNDPASASTIKSLPWVADGIDDAELEDVQLLAYLAAIHPSVFNALLTKSWIADSLDETEQELMAAVKSIADEDASAALHVLTLPFLETLEPDDVPAVDSLAFLATAREGNNFRVFNALIGKPWVSDGLEEAELKVLDDIRSIADSDESAALQTLALPFLDTIEPDDGLTVDSLLRLVVYRQSDSPDIFNALIEKPWVSDGLDEAERVIVGNIRWIADHDESASLQLLASPFLDAIDPDDSVTMETLLTFRQDYGQQLSIDPISALIKKSWVADGLDDVEIQLVDNIRWIADNSKSAALRVIALPFLDILEPDDGAAVESLAYIVAAREGNNVPVFDALIEKPWLADGMDQVEQDLVNNIRAFAEIDESITLTLIERPWLADGLDEVEQDLVHKIRVLADEHEDVALQIITLPFLADAVDADDADVVDSLSRLASIGERDGLEIFHAAIQKPWVSDGLDESERVLMENIEWIANNNEAAAVQLLSAPFLDTIEPGDKLTMDVLGIMVVYEDRRSLPLFDALIEKAWVSDGLDEVEQDSVNNVHALAQINESLALSFIEKPWLADDVSEAEFEVVRSIREIAESDQDLALQALRMPFLESIETADGHAMSTIQSMSHYSRSNFQRLTNHPILSGGITDQIAKTIPVLVHFVNRDEPQWDLVDTLLDPDNDLLEEKTITLPLRGEVDLAIFRTTPGSPRNMGYLEHAVRVNEEFTGVPFPTDYVAVLFADVPGTGGGGGHYGTHIVGGPLHDNGGDDYVTTYSHGLLAHETAHYYWRHGKPWIDEGPASFMTERAQIARIGHPWRDHFVLCGHFRTIAEMDEISLSYGEPGSACIYSLGERLFMDLYNTLGDSEFRKAFRNLYLLSQVQGNECEGTSLNICHLRAAFVRNASEESAAIAEKVIARWYDGTEPYAPTEVVLPDPVIPSIGGRVDMLVSATHGGPSIQGKLYESEKTAEDHPHVRLTISYNYPYEEPTRDVKFKVLTYFEDGFAFHSGTVKFTLQSGHQQTSSHWTSLGLNPHEPWPIGRYWVSAYLDGEKVAEEAFEVLP